MKNPDDPRGLIADAYKINGISAAECRSIFLDWALEPRNAGEIRAASARLLAQYAPLHPLHPMSGILRDSVAGLSATPKRRGGRARLIR